MLEIKIDESHFIGELPLKGTLTLPEKGIVHLSGDNGIGKSTLCSYLYHQKLLHQEVVWSEAHQFRSIYPVTVESVLDIYKYNAIHLDHERFKKLIQIFDLLTWSHRSWDELSSGQGQMLKLLMNLSLKAQTYLLDEPAHFLDRAKLSALSHLIQEMSHSCLIILVDHRIEWLEVKADVHFQMLIQGQTLILEKQ